MSCRTLRDDFWVAERDGPRFRMLTEMWLARARMSSTLGKSWLFLFDDIDEFQEVNSSRLADLSLSLGLLVDPSVLALVRLSLGSVNANITFITALSSASRGSSRAFVLVIRDHKCFQRIEGLADIERHCLTHPTMLPGRHLPDSFNNIFGFWARHAQNVRRQCYVARRNFVVLCFRWFLLSVLFHS
jgi:hypothetical protein